MLVCTAKTQFNGVLNTGSGNFDSAVSIAPGNDRSAPLRAGDNVVLKGTGYDGTYSPIGAIRGTAENPIFFRAETNEKRIGLKGKFNLNQPYLGVAYQNFDGGGVCVEIAAKGCRVHRNFFKGQSSSDAIILVSAIDTQRCGSTSTASTASWLRDRGWRQRWQEDPRGSDRAQRLLRPQVLGRSGNGGRVPDGSVQRSPARLPNNLFRKCVQNSSGEKEIISGKTGGMTFQGNTVEDSPGVWVSARTSDRSKFTRNWPEHGAFLKMRAMAIWSMAITALASAEIYAGNAYSTSQDLAQCANDPTKGRNRLVWKGKCAGAHCGARDAIIENNGGEIRIGNKTGGEGGTTCKADRIALKNNQRAAAKTLSGCGTNINESGVGEYTQVARKLTPNDVGHLAAA